MEQRLRPIFELMDMIINDTTVPRNIRKAVSEAKEKLLNEKDELSVRASAAVYILDEISNDINMPMHARTRVWNLISALERIAKE